MVDLTGQQIGQYYIVARISKGATSTIYKAYQAKLNRFVAIKVLSPYFTEDPGFLERFAREAQAVARLDHPNILPVYDFDRKGDLAYLVMKYVETGTLRDMLKGKPLDLETIYEIVSQVGYALGYAHQHGIVHRDVKPGNILIAEGNWALLSDFGLAKILESPSDLTKSGVGLGTPDYMAPEQAQGLAVDARTDIYALGAVLYEMATGHVPFEAETAMAVIVKHLTEPLRPPRQLNPELPRAVEDVILKAMAKDPDRRFQSAEAMIAALERAVQHQDRPLEISARLRPAPAAERVRDLWDRARWSGSVLRSKVVARWRDWSPWLRSRSLVASTALRRSFQRLGPWLRLVGGALGDRGRRGGQWMAQRVAHRAVPRARLLGRRLYEGIYRGLDWLGNRTRDLVLQGVGTVGARWQRMSRRTQRAAGLVALLLVLILCGGLALFRPPSAVGTDGTPTATLTLAGTTEVVAAQPTSTSTFTPTPAPTATPTPSPTPTITPSPTPSPTPMAARSGMVAVPAGPVWIGSTMDQINAAVAFCGSDCRPEQFLDENPIHQVYVDSFYIDKFEVTNAQFAYFVSKTGYVTDAERAGDQVTWRTFNTPDRKYHPVIYVSWNDANAFCRWVGKRLPTEAEWEKAARGTDKRIWPWGDGWNPGVLNSSEYGAGQPLRVGSFKAGVSPYGAYDMAGNVWEWVADWYSAVYYQESPVANPRGPADQGMGKVIKGGSWKVRGYEARVSSRQQASVDGRSDDIGFRCALSAP